jgi:hypothetical protein
MNHEGMVHALEEIHRLITPDGCLIDIHPFMDEEFIEVHQGGKIAFAEPVPAFNNEELLHAEDALARVVQRQIFIVERASSFDFFIYASSVAELQAYFDEVNAFDESSRDEAVKAGMSALARRVEKAARAAGEGAEVVYRNRAHIWKLNRRYC